jgi:citrate lyase subunit beta/citryl-CoA lyase
VPAIGRTLARGPQLAVDEVVLDLEDSVPPDRKAEAREATAAAIAGRPWEAATVSVRINSVASDWGADDVAAVDATPWMASCTLHSLYRSLRTATTCFQATFSR